MNTQFFGREDELAQIQSHWEKIASGNVDDESVSNIMVVTGSTGEGKTRLIQRFYETLANDPEWNLPSNAFWPSEFQGQDGVLRVNPDTSNHEPGGPPRFMWLGMRWQSAEVRNLEERRCPIPEARTVLRLHNDQIIKYQSVWEKLWATGKNKFINQLKDGCIDTLLDYLPIGGFGFKTIGTFASTIYEANQSAKSRRENQTKVQLGDTEAFLDDLAEFYKRKVSIPLVLFLDDAQWIDESTVQFLDSFLKEIKKRKLPVLILITHWIAEWNQLKEQDDQSNLYSICDRNHVKEMNLKRIDVAALRELLMTKLPGLTPVQQKLIIDKSCDNFLSLEENIGYLLDTPQNFVEEDISKELTDVGVAEISSWEDDRKKRIKTQFNKLEKETKRLLGWSSQIGERFLASVIGEVAKQEALASNLNVTFKKVEQRAYIAPVNAFFKEFRDRAIFQIAQHYFKTYDSRMEQVITNAIKSNSVHLIHDSFDESGYVKTTDWVKCFPKKTAGFINYDASEKRDLLGMMQRVYGFPDKNTQSSEQYTLSARILLLDFLNDCECDLIGKAKSKAKEFEKIDWSYLVEDGIGLIQRRKLSNQLYKIDCPEIALNILTDLEKSHLYIDELYLSDSLSGKIIHDQLKARCLVNLGHGEESLDVLLDLVKSIESHPNYNNLTRINDNTVDEELQFTLLVFMSQLTEAYADTALQIGESEWSKTKNISISEMLTKAADLFEEMHKIRITKNWKNNSNPFPELRKAIWCLRCCFEYDMNESSPYSNSSALTKGIRLAKQLAKAGHRNYALLDLFDIYYEGSIIFSINLFHRAAKQCWKRAKKVSAKLQANHNLALSKQDLYKIQNHHNFALTDMESEYYYRSGDGKKALDHMIKCYKKSIDIFERKKTLEAMEVLASDSFRLANCYYMENKKYKQALKYFYKSIVVHEELFICTKRIEFLGNIFRMIGSISHCESVPPSNKATSLLQSSFSGIKLWFENYSEESKESKKEFGMLLLRCGVGFLDLDQFIKAQFFLEKSILLFSEIEESVGMPHFIRFSRMPFGYLAINHIYLKDEKKFLSNYQKFLSYFDRLPTESVKKSYLDRFLSFIRLLFYSDKQISEQYHESKVLIMLRPMLAAKYFYPSDNGFIFQILKALIRAMNLTKQITYLTKIRVGMVEYSFKCMKYNNKPADHDLYIATLIFLTKAFIGDHQKTNLILEEAALAITNAKATHPDFISNHLEEMLSMAKAGWIGNEDCELV